MKNHAFTLIELLVVVLIIGILSAIALPQYQKAVEKARLSEVFIGLKALRVSSDLYYMENGVRPYDFTVLSIDFPVTQYSAYEGKENAQIVVGNDSYYYLDTDGYIAGSGTNIPVQLEYHIGSKQYLCRVFTSQSDTTHKGHGLCKSLGGKFLRELSGSTFYSLPM